MAASEYVILEQVHKLMVNKGEELKKAARVRTIFNAAALIIIGAAMLLAEFTPTPAFLCILLGVLGGVALSVPGYIRVAIASWLHIAPHIDEKGLKSRLDLVKHR